MGQILQRISEIHNQPENRNKPSFDIIPKRFPDLNKLPPELALLVLSNLNATDLCLASCVWDNLANDEFLWNGLCRSQWGQVSAYRRCNNPGFSYKRLYLQLDEATLTFNADPALGLHYLLQNGLVDDDATEIALFLHTARQIDWQQQRHFLATRPDVVDVLVKLQNFENQFLPNALRKFFSATHPPKQHSNHLNHLVDKFSERFCDCNPQLGFTKDVVYVVCYSLIMLSVDLTSPHIRNKMSKREFIRNTRQAAQGINDEFAGHLYDNIYLIGHVAPKNL